MIIRISNRHWQINGFQMPGACLYFLMINFSVVLGAGLQ